MINSISSMSSATSLMRTNSLQRQPPPPDRDVFKLADTDSNGVVSGTELETLVKGIEKVTGNTIDQDALNSYDADGDGGLNSEELLGLMQSNGFSGPEMLDIENGDSGMRPPPPPPPSTEQVLASYASNSGGDMLSQLIDLLNGETSQQEVSSIDLQS